MVRLTGYVEIAGRRELLDWTIADGRIIEGAGLGSHGITVKVDEAPVAPSPTPTPETPVDAPAPVEPKSLEDMNKTELQVECSTRGLPTTGTKADLLARLTAGEAEGEAEVEPSPEGEGNGESDSE
jgi:hypothetical protein